MNPKDRVAQSKPRISQLPLAPLMEVWVALYEGARKYSPWNWRFEKVNETVYIDAAVGHLLSYRCGESIDPDSGVSHITKAIAGLIILRDAQIHGSSVDDRIILQDLHVAWCNQKVAELDERYEQVSGPIDDVTEPTYGIRDKVEPETVQAEPRSTTLVAGGGDRELCADDVGRTIILRDGTRTILDSFGGPNKWKGQFGLDGLDATGCSVTIDGHYGSSGNDGYDVVAVIDVQLPHLTITQEDVGRTVEFDERHGPYYSTGIIVDWDGGDGRPVKVSFGSDWQWYSTEGIKNKLCVNQKYPDQILRVRR